jgi:hypothetical protein
MTVRSRPVPGCAFSARRAGGHPGRGDGRCWREAVVGRFTISAKRANREDQPQPEVDRHRVILGGFAIDWAERNCTISIVLPSPLARAKVFNSLTADR